MNSRKGFVSLYGRYRGVSIYSFHEEGKERCDLDEFFATFERSEYSADLDVIISLIDEMTRRGVDRRRFRRKGEGSVDALPGGLSELRLYCFPCCRDVIIFGNGCVKKGVRTLQEVAECKQHWSFLVALEKEFTHRVMEGSLYWRNERDGFGIYTALHGDTYFEI